MCVCEQEEVIEKSRFMYTRVSDRELTREWEGNDEILFSLFALGCGLPHLSLIHI